jgi:hypothetical protein
MYGYCMELPYLLPLFLLLGGVRTGLVMVRGEYPTPEKDFFSKPYLPF